ncbi:hypothetical protein, partial [Streptomyces tateyamensis]|uniref:hypothetical protein n=1 Tax=Streptomyces tateyamensis TaxID=565073 RepID=UPI001C649A25
ELQPLRRARSSSASLLPERMPGFGAAAVTRPTGRVTAAAPLRRPVAAETDLSDPMAYCDHMRIRISFVNCLSFPGL